MSAPVAHVVISLHAIVVMSEQPLAAAQFAESANVGGGGRA
jgi:hypothetical protein